MPRPRPPLPPGALPVVLVAAVVVGSAAAGPWRTTLHLPGLPSLRTEWPPPSLARQTPPHLPLPHPPPGEHAWGLFPVLLVGLALVALAVGLALAVRAVLRGWRPPGRQHAEADEQPPGEALMVQRVVAGVEAAELAAAEARTPRDAVVGAWVALEAGAAESGVPRAAATTPTEFVLDVLDRTGAEPAAVRRLLALYEHARFSTDPVTPADVAAARACLAWLREGLSVSVA